jgi:hypothetical protein
MNLTDDVLQRLHHAILVNLPERLLAALQSVMEDLEPSRFSPRQRIMSIVIAREVPTSRTASAVSSSAHRSSSASKTYMMLFKPSVSMKGKFLALGWPERYTPGRM